MKFRMIVMALASLVILLASSPSYAQTANDRDRCRFDYQDHSPEPTQFPGSTKALEAGLCSRAQSHSAYQQLDDHGCRQGPTPKVQSRGLRPRRSWLHNATCRQSQPRWQTAPT